MAGSWQVLQVNSEICIFCSATQYIVSKKQPAGSAHDVSADSSETVFDEAHFIANLVPSNPYPSPRHTISPSESFGPHFPRQNNFQNSFYLDTSKTALVSIFSSILNHT